MIWGFLVLAMLAVLELATIADRLTTLVSRDKK